MPRQALPRVSIVVLALLTLGVARSAVAQFVVTHVGDDGDGSLRQAILDADALPGPAVIVITATGTLATANPLPPITNPYGLSISGSIDATGAPRFTIDANGDRGLFIFATDPATQTARGNVTINNLRIINGRTVGGTGGAGSVPGGGGAGLGGGLLVLQGNVSLVNVEFSNNSAVGGDGGQFFSDNVYGAGGGGGLGGDGGIGGRSTLPVLTEYQGGGGGIRGNGTDQRATGGAGGFPTAFRGALSGFAGGGTSSDGNIGAPDAGGGGGTGPGVESAGGGGLGGQAAPDGNEAGKGGLGGGGGGGLFLGGAGGFGGGGGGGVGGGAGGFGGGGGSAGLDGTPGHAGFGAGAGLHLGSGGGLGAGGAIFVRAGNMLSLQDVTFSGDAVAGGRATGDSSGHAGSAIGQALFLGNDVTYTVANGKTITLADSIGGGNDPEARGGLTVKGNGTLVLAAADNSYVGDTIVQSGTLRVSGSIAASRGVTTNAGATFDAAATQRVASLTLNSGGQAKVSAGVLVVGDNAQAKPLTVAGDGSGRLDVGSNGLVLDHSPGNDAADLLYARSLVTQGYNGGHWRGNGITSGSAGGDSTKAVGYAPAEAALPFANGAGTDTFLGTVVDRSSILLRYTLAGDANLDGMVDFQDLVRLAQSYNMDASSSADGPWAHGDSTYDGKVDFADLVRLAQNYNGSLPAGPIAGVPADFESDLVLAEASVPEPLSTEMICAVGIWGCVIRRRGPASGGGLARAGSEFTL